MKHIKSIISLLVALCIVATMSVAAFATELPSEPEVQAEEIQGLLDETKIVKFDKFSGTNKVFDNNYEAYFSGDTDYVGTNGLLYANGKEVNTLYLNEASGTDAFNFGDTWQASVTFTRDNTSTSATKNCFGEKYELTVGDVTLKVGNQQEGVALYEAELWYKDEEIGYVMLDANFSGTYAIRYTKDKDIGKLYVVKDNENMAWNVVDSTLVSVDSANGVTSYYNITDADFSAAKVSVVAAGNNAKDKTNYAYGLWMAKKFYSTTRTGNGTTGTTGTTSGSTGGNSGKTGDDRMVLPIVLVLTTLVIAGAGVVLTSKKSCKE